MNMKRLLYRAAGCISGLLLFASAPLSVLAEPVDYQAEMEARKSLPVQTNQITNWPEGPLVGAQSAILMDADTGAILYAKNVDEQLYPASVTKIMTCLLAIENAGLDEMVTFSEEAVFSIERDSSNIGMDVGESITMEQALQGILILSANEVANAVGEHVAGSAEAFVQMMNDRAAELGCENTHFCNANGLHDESHYTSARDLALIAKEFFSHETLANISGTTYCTFEATATQPDSFSLATKNQLVKGKEREYEFLVGSKTGYTSHARQTLVSCAEKDGMKLICVVLMEESPCQFTDTVALFDYGFENFSKVNIAANDTTYTMNSRGFFTSGADIFGSSAPIISLEKNNYVILPGTVSFQDLESELIYDADYANSIATVRYTYQGNFVGQSYLQMQGSDLETFAFGDKTADATVPSADPDASSEGSIADSPSENAEGGSEEAPAKPVTNNDENSVFINVKVIVIVLSCIVAAIVIFLIVRSFIRNYHFARRRRSVMKRNRDKFKASDFDKF